ncbi:MFS transporter [Saccharopolyspora rosea]|uniref:MFS transporter n=1 Tax=Saccharopolyspora rosea TaxID=524884 RepID=A0ABW3FZZ9_9PSEU|nr:MFS transporter [Saccharopolyspora rosea]
MPIALLALAVGAFGIGMTEFVMMGVLPQAAADLGVSIPTAGNLITAYALGVVIGAPALTVLGARLPRKTLLVLTMSMFTVGNALFAFAPTADFGMAFRFLAGLPHGAFFGAGAVVAAGLAGHGKRAKAVSMMFMGLTLANVVGVPLGTLLGQHFGWRATFAVVAAVGVAAIVAIARLVPHQGRPSPKQAAVLEQVAAFRHPQVWLALSIVTFGLGGTFACLSYLSPVLTEVSGYSPTAMTMLLALAGLGMTVGNFVGGRIADRALMPGVYAALIGIAAVLAAFTITSGNKVTAAVTVFLIGALGFMVAPIMQALVMKKAAGAPSLVSAALQSAFNIANSIGASAGGLAIAHGFGLLSPNVVGSLLSLLGLALAVVAGVLDRSGRREPATEPAEPVTEPVAEEAPAEPVRPTPRPELVPA